MCTIQNVNVSTLVFCDTEAKVHSTEEGKCHLKVNSQYNARQLMVSCLTYDVDVPLTLYFINISPPPLLIPLSTCCLSHSRLNCYKIPAQ